MVERLAIEQVALVGTTRRIPDHAGRTTGQGDRTMTEVLKAMQQQQRHEIADMKAVGGRVEAAIQGDRTCLEPGPERSVVGGVLDQAATTGRRGSRHPGADCSWCQRYAGPWFMDTLLQTTAQADLLVLVAVLLVATSCSVETKDFDALFGDDFNIGVFETARSNSGLRPQRHTHHRTAQRTNRTDVGIGEIQNSSRTQLSRPRTNASGVTMASISRPSFEPPSNVSAGGIAQGGSTIPEYVGNVFLDRSEQTGSRKVEEIFMARRFEQRHTKEFILEKYLNWVYRERCLRRRGSRPHLLRAANLRTPNNLRDR